MALPGELVGIGGATCDCGQEMELEVLTSFAGYYLGYWCENCGPYSRETHYMSKEIALEELEKIQAGQKSKYERNTDYYG